MNALLPPFGSPAGEAARAALLGLGFALVFVLAEAWRRAAAPPVEWTRKAIHVACGLLALTLPWMIARVSTLLVLTAAAVAALAAARRAGRLGALFAVERSSRGEAWFALAILLLFVVGRTQPVFYAVSIITLVVCDALAAVLGRAYGRHAYVVTTERKSLEGSAAFLVAAFLGILLPLLLATDLSRPAAVLIAAQLALLLTAFEAISAGGSDNVVVPIATYYLLLKLTENTAGGIALQLAAQGFLLVATLVLARTTGLLTFSGALAAHLVLYAAFSLGDPLWTVAPALALAGFVVLDAVRARRRHRAAGEHHVSSMFHVAIVATVVLFADNTLGWSRLAGPAWGQGHPFAALFVGALAAPLAIVARGTLGTLAGRARIRGMRGALAAGALAYVVVVPLGLLGVRGRPAPLDWLVAALVTGGALIAFELGRRRFRVDRGSSAELRLLGASVGAATLAVAPLALEAAGAFAGRAR